MKKRKHILLVEDAAIIAMHLGVEIKKAGYHLSDHVSTGEEAITSARHFKPDLILMDIRLSGPMDGLTAAKIIKDEMNIPSVIISGYNHHFSTELPNSLFQYLPKPVDFDKLNRIMEGIFSA